MDTITLILLFSTSFLLGAFIIIYFTRSSWRQTDIGRALLLSKMSLFLLATQMGLSSVFDFGPFNSQWATAVNLLLVVLSQGYMLYSLLRANRRKK